MRHVGTHGHYMSVDLSCWPRGWPKSGVQNNARGFTVIRTLRMVRQSIIVCCRARFLAFFPTRADDERLPRSL